MIARSRKAGHFVIVKVGEKGERIPLTIAGADTTKGTITLVIQAVGGSSKKICELNAGDYITDLVGPLGQATHIEKVGTVVCAGGGVGVAPLLPIVEAFHKAGNRVIVVLAARTKELVILEEQMRANSDEVIVMTDDGSYGTKGLVTNGVESVINREKVDLCVTIGPAVMMKFVSALTKKYEIPTVASLNTIMVDGTGMCGACRITVGGKTKFVCVDGPEFDAHQVDFDEMLMRLGAYKDIGVVKASAVSGVELACWDLIGKAAGKPVCELLGGAVRDRVRVYANGWTGGATDPAIIREKAAAALEYGYSAFKFSLAVPSWPVRDLETVRRIRRAAETIREAVGPDSPLLFDGHGRYDSRLAIQVGQALEELNLMFFEEPVQPEDEEGMALVADKVNIPIAAGERLTRLQEFRRLFEKRAICIAQPDLAHCHGFGEGLKVAHLAEAFDGFVAPHCPMSPVITAISLHLDAVAPNFLIQERLFLDDWRNEIITEPLKVKEGYLELPSGPGWGIELDMEMVRKHPRIVAGTPRLFRPDGAVCDW